MCEDDSADPIKPRAETIEELPLSSKVWKLINCWRNCFYLCLVQVLEQLPTSLEERSVAAVVEAKNKKNSLGANRWTAISLRRLNYVNPPFRFIKEEADAGTKAKPTKVEKEKLETEKAAPSKVGGDLLSIPKKDFDKFLQEIKHSQQVQRRRHLKREVFGSLHWCAGDDDIWKVASGW